MKHIFQARSMLDGTFDPRNKRKGGGVRLIVASIALLLGLGSLSASPLSTPSRTSAQFGTSLGLISGDSCLATVDTLGYSACYGSYDTLFTCDFESGIFGCGGWSVDGGSWEVGTPTAPPTPHTGFGVAATILSGNYSYSIDARLVSKSIPLPALATCEHLELRFWHYFQTERNNDFGNVEIATMRGSVWGPWEPIRNNPTQEYSGYSGSWSSPVYDLSAYADSTVRVSFRFRTNGCCTNDRGWYLDDVVVRRSHPVMSTAAVVESFDAGLGEWWVDGGQWTAGAATSPVMTHSGSGCAGTGILGNYDYQASTRLVSPPYDLPSLGPCRSLRLRFWQFIRSELTHDHGSVEISTRRGEIWSPFTAIRGGDASVSGYGMVWSSPCFDLSSYADSTVRIAFRFDTNGCCTNDRGWFIDDVMILDGPTWTPVENPKNEGVSWETFETGAPDWCVDAGVWEIGAPTSPPDARTGNACAGTVLDGNYGYNESSRLISPPVRLGPIADSPVLRFWHWYRTENGPDYGVVEASVLRGGGWSDWTQIGGPYTNTSGGIWTPQQLSLDAYADSTVRVAFRFNTNGCCTLDRGWYIDDVQVLGTVTDVGGDALSNGPPRMHLYSNVPNPFNPTTMIRFELGHAGIIDLIILNVAGREVRHLPLGELGPGLHHVTWDGRDDRGQSVASGVYWYRLRTADESASKAMVLVR